MHFNNWQSLKIKEGGKKFHYSLNFRLTQINIIFALANYRISVITLLMNQRNASFNSAAISALNFSLKSKSVYIISSDNNFFEHEDDFNVSNVDEDKRQSFLSLFETLKEILYAVLRI